MSITIFTLPTYKDMTHVSEESYLAGKACSCHGTELEDFLPVWRKLTCGKFPGSLMKLKKRIYDKEYSMYPIVFLTSECWPASETLPERGYTTVHVVQKQNQNVKHCKSFDHKYIDREVGVIICEKTILHDGAKEPSFKYWLYEKDTRTELPSDILHENFSNERTPGSYHMVIKKFITDEQYDIRIGYLSGDAIRNLIAKHLGSHPIAHGIKFIEWDYSWNFVIHDYFGDKMFKVNMEDALAFFERNNITFDESVEEAAC